MNLVAYGFVKRTLRSTELIAIVCVCVCQKCIEEYEKHEKMMKHLQSFRSIDRHILKVEINV